MSLSLIACIGKNNELGKDNHLVFHLKEDMKFFSHITQNHSVVMGLNTWKSLNQKPLKNRQNFVVSRQTLHLENAQQISDFETFIKTPHLEEIFIIGGASIYAQALPYCDILYLTEVDKEVDADVFFPTFDKSLFKREILKSTTENDIHFSIVKYIRLNKINIA